MTKRCCVNNCDTGKNGERCKNKKYGVKQKSLFKAPRVSIYHKQFLIKTKTI